MKKSLKLWNLYLGPINEIFLWTKVSRNLKYGIIEVQVKKEWVHKYLRRSDDKKYVLKENVYHLYSAINKYSYDLFSSFWVEIFSQVKPILRVKDVQLKKYLNCLDL